MTVFEINGKKRLQGDIEVQGSKNSVLPILAATLLIQDKCIIHNCPMLSDVEAALKILVMLGCVCVRDDETVIVDASGASNYEIPEELMREMRSSVLFLGAVVSRMGRAAITTPGGCELGPRPIDLHISSLKRLGVNINNQDGYIECSTPNGIQGNAVELAFPSVGATENIIIAAAVSRGTTVISGAACEPEISDLADFLNSAGAKITGAGSSVIMVEGVKKLHSCEHRVIPDRIVAATFLSAAAITRGEILLRNVSPANFMSILGFYKNIGCKIIGKGQDIYLKCELPLKENACIKTGIYPEFPTDAGPITVPFLCTLKGESRITETIFQNRFRFLNELKKFGANVFLEDKTAVIKGTPSFNAANASCTDLRGGAALVVASLAADGISTVENIHHIERGYCNLPYYLSKLGADVREVEK